MPLCVTMLHRTTRWSVNRMHKQRKFLFSTTNLYLLVPNFPVYSKIYFSNNYNAETSLVIWTRQDWSILHVTYIKIVRYLLNISSEIRKQLTWKRFFIYLLFIRKASAKFMVFQFYFSDEFNYNEWMNSWPVFRQ